MRLRNLEEIEAAAECTLIKQNDVSGNVKLDCLTISDIDLSSAEGLNIESDEISGIPELADPAKTDIQIREGTVPDYNNEEVFNKELPIINSAEIDGFNCGDDGTFKIVNGISTEDIAKNDDINNFDVKLSNPISSGFCNISSVNNKNINFNCGSKDKFDYNTVVIERQQLLKDNNTLFIINSVESKQPFNCIINSNYKMGIIPGADNGTIYNQDQNDTIDDEDNIIISKRYNYYNKNNRSSGLSGGAIAAIILVCCAAVIATGVLIGLIKSGKILGSKQNKASNLNENSSTFNAFVYKP